MLLLYCVKPGKHNLRLNGQARKGRFEWNREREERALNCAGTWRSVLFYAGNARVFGGAAPVPLSLCVSDCLLVPSATLADVFFP